MEEDEGVCCQGGGRLANGRQTKKICGGQIPPYPCPVPRSYGESFMRLQQPRDQVPFALTEAPFQKPASLRDKSRAPEIPAVADATDYQSPLFATFFTLLYRLLEYHRPGTSSHQMHQKDFCQPKYSLNPSHEDGFKTR